jgi:hypothetical protein
MSPILADPCGIPDGHALAIERLRGYSPVRLPSNVGGPQPRTQVTSERPASEFIEHCEPPSAQCPLRALAASWIRGTERQGARSADLVHQGSWLDVELLLIASACRSLVQRQ